MNRNVWLLFCCQALMNAIMSGQTVMAALIGHSLAVDKALNTLPMAIQMTAMMCASIPASMVFARLGRKPGFWLGCLGSLLGSLTFALGVWYGSFPLYCLGAVPAGLGWGIAQHLRFAAAEVAAPRCPPARHLAGDGRRRAGRDRRAGDGEAHQHADPAAGFPRHLCLPDRAAGDRRDPAAVHQVPPLARAEGAPVPFRTILTRPNFVTAVVCSMVGYGTMNLVMASTPLQMMFCGFGIGASADVIRAHSIAMFLPGFVTGRLIQRFGVHRIIFAGGLLTLLCVAVNVAFNPTYATFMVALVLLGVGWNFMFVGGTTLLTTAYAPAERVRVQATNDFIVFGTVACTAFTSGAVQATAGWAALNLTVVPPVVIAVSLIGWHWAARTRLAPA